MSWHLHLGSFLLGQYLMIVFSPRLHLFFTRSLVADRRTRVDRHVMAPLVFWALHWLGTSHCLSVSSDRRGLRMNRRAIKPAPAVTISGALMLLGLGALWQRGSGGCRSRAGRNGPRAFAAARKRRCAFRPFAARSATAMAYRWCRTGPVTRSIFICRRWSKAIANVMASRR